MWRIALICLLVWTLTITAVQGTVAEESSSSVLFTSMRQATLQTAYGHLVVPLNIPSLKKAFDHYSDLQSAINKLVSGNTESYNHLQSELKTLRSKLDIIHHLALTKQQDSHFSGVDNLNDFKEKIIANLGTKVNQWKTSTEESTSTTVTSTSGGRKKRQTAAVVGGLIQLAGFTLSIFNRHELSSIRDSVENAQTDSKYVASQVSDAFLRLDTLTEHTENVYQALINIAKTNRNLHKAHKKEVIIAEVDRLSRIFVSETSTFLTGLQALLDNKFSPLLVDPEKVQGAYDEVVDKAKEVNLKPLTEDSDLIFQSETSVLGTAEGDLICIIHIPLYSGELMNLFRYVPAPFLLQDGLTTTIRSDKSYLALDPSGTLGKELSEAEIFRCKRINCIYHCGSENVMQKNLSQLCLFNLYKQRMKEIERFCDVTVSEVASHAVQLSGNQFRILVSRPTQLTITCLEGAKVETIQGIHLLTLTKECPKANTPDHFFVRNPHIVSSQELILLPLVHDAKEWLKDVNATDEGVDLREIFKELKQDHTGRVPMNKFKYRVIHHQTFRFKTWLMYLQLTLTVIGVVVLSYNFITLSIKYLFPLISRFIPERFRRKKDKIRQYRVIRRPRQDIELRQRIRPSAPPVSSI